MNHRLASLKVIGAVRKIHNVGRKCSMHYLNLELTTKEWPTSYVSANLILKINRTELSVAYSQIVINNAVRGCRYPNRFPSNSI